MARLLLMLGCLISTPLLAQEAGGDVIRRGIPGEAFDAIDGCWETDGERWTIRREGRGRASVLRVVEGPRGERMGRRARLESELMFEPATGRFAFSAAGRIHGLLILFETEGDGLRATPFSRRRGLEPRWTGSTYTLTPCAE
ncbi:MAG: hypothetical protein JJ863_01485 [Deltaproteobacteria bacterium]|nr:hypothetical protein [Deltaproteobacteria bacterium]